MTKTLRVDLADLEGIPHASGPSGTSVTVTAEYTSPVILEADGTIILSPKSKTMGASGRVDFDGIYASDSEDVREDHRGFAVRVKVAIREPNGATRTWSRTVKPLEFMTSTVRLGRMPSAEGLPPQWVSVDDVIAAANTAADAASQAATSAEASATLAGQAQAAAYQIPDQAWADMADNPATQTRQTLNAITHADFGMVTTPNATPAENVATVETAAADAAAAGVPLIVKGSFSINDRIDLPAGSIVDLRDAVITQTAALTGALLITGDGARITGGTLQGLGTDYVAAQSVYGASAITVADDVDSAVIEDVKMLDWAGAGVNIAATTTGTFTVRGCTITGPGPAYLTDVSFNISAGIRFLGTAANGCRMFAQGNDISGFAQGILTALGAGDLHIVDNLLHDIPAQHGAYLQTSSRLVFTGNIMRDCGSNGMKVQMSTSNGADSFDVIISDNIVSNVGVVGLSLASNPGGGSNRHRGAVMSGNVITGAGYGLTVTEASGAILDGNQIRNTTAASILVDSSGDMTISGNRIRDSRDEGIRLNSCADIIVSNNRIADPAQAGSTATDCGIRINGACADITVADNVITDAGGNMRYGIFSSASSGQETFSVRHNYVSGATQYGIRFMEYSTVREFRGNNSHGASGGYLRPPTATTSGEVIGTDTGTSPPTAGRFESGWIRWNTAPAGGGWVGWVCVTAGTPGQWRAFGQIDSP